jgi:hypothetical protein
MRNNGTLICLRYAASGHANAYILENIGGEWLPGTVTGTFYTRAGALPLIFRGSS